MKVAILLAQYLYSNKKVSLQGIGNFTLDANAVIEPEQNKNSKSQQHIEGIHFESNTSAKQDEGLIGYISSQTGKMKALASSDLDSYLELAMQFLNIGKPFQIEGIGTIIKTQSGKFEFTPGQAITEKLKDPSVKEMAATSVEESFSGYSDLYPKKEKNNSPAVKWVAILLIVAGTGLAIWAGYAIYKRSASNSIAADSSAVSPIETVLVPDSSLQKKDSTVNSASPVSKPAVPTGSYKFVFENTNSKSRALKRFQFVSSINPNIKLETTDSVNFKISVTLPVTVADTSRIKDSLNAWYYGYGHKNMVVTIEN
ncbi:MAG: hypothetical protein JSU05_04655 [Bacteroidetes bacterium]|nr:hypothetical protein [Bacteroidota bacterium]